MKNENQNPEETGKKEFNLFDFLFGWMKSSPKEEPVKTENEDGSPRDPAEIEAETKEREEAKANAPKKSKAGMFTFLGIALIIGIVLLFIFANPFSSKDGKEKAKVEKTTDPSQPGGGNTQPGGGNTQPGGGNTQPGGGNNNQPVVQNGLQLTFNYSQTFEWSGLDANEQARLKTLETQTNKLIVPINVNLKDIIETGKSKITNYEGKGYDMIQLQYVENGNVKTVFTRPGNIAIAL